MSRRSFKRLGLVLSMVLVVVWFGSTWAEFGFGITGWSVGIQHGTAWIGREPYVVNRSAWCELSSETLPWRWWPDAFAWDGAWWIIYLPVWPLLVVVVIPTAVLLWQDRKRPVGHCQHCGYSLTGNTSGVCPECGTRA